MRRQILTAAIGLVAAVGLAACSGGGSTVPLPPTSAPPPSLDTETITEQPTVTVTATQTETATATSTATATTTVEPPSTEAPPPPPPSTEEPPPSEPTIESAPDEAKIRSDAVTAFQVANRYWMNLFGTWHGNYGEPVYWYPSSLYRGDGFYDSDGGEDFYCGGESLGPINASFCGADAALSGTIAWDLQLFRQQEGKFGDAPVYAIVAHEVGHAAQARFRFDNEAGAAPPSHTVAEEQQADCLSGATLAKAEQDGYLTADPGDFEEIVNSFMALKEQDGGDHGNAADRLHAFEHGYNSGDVESCLYNRAVPPPGLFL